MNNLFKYLLILSFLTACDAKKADQTAGIKQTYTCPMHPQIVQDKAGTCPICGMDLVLVSAGGDKTEVTLSESQVELANISIQHVSMQDIGNSILLNGRLRADETQTEVVSTRVSGRLDKLFIKETGVPISKGQVIYEVYSEQLLTLQREFLLAHEQASSIANELYESYLQAAKKKLRLYGMTEAQITSLSNSKTINPRIQFAAPASGIITEMMVSEGQYVTEGTAIYKLEKLKSLWAEAELYPSEASLIKSGDPVTVSVSGFENQPMKSTVIFLSPEYRQGSQIFILRAGLPNSEYQFMPGMRAELVFEHSKRKALTLPADAVIREENGAHVYKKTGKGKFKAQMVTTGLENFNNVEITEGIKEGDTVVVTGAYLLYSELILKKGTNPMAGHTHTAAKKAAPKQLLSKPEVEENRLPASPEFSQQLELVFASYLKVKDALVASDAEAASGQAINMTKALQNVDMSLLEGAVHMKWMEQLKDMEGSIKLIRASKDIEIQRASFSRLSDALYASIKNLQVKGFDAYYQYCPMAFDNKGAYWLSESDVIKNPYFGDMMLSCGEIKETYLSGQKVFEVEDSAKLQSNGHNH